MAWRVQVCYSTKVPYKDPARQSAYQTEWQRQRRLAWIVENGPCIDCDTWNLLQVDHIDAQLKITHRIWSWSKKRREAELAKCVVRCDSCHRKKTIEQQEHSYGEKHGSAKLTVQDVLAIRASTEAYRVLAKQYKVDHTLIYQIKKRKIWKHI